MNRLSQNLLITLVGGSVLAISAFSGVYLNYVKPGFRPFLILAGGVLLVIGVVGVIKELREETETPGHDHGPGVAWLLALPVCALFLIAPPALGAYSVERAPVRPPAPPVTDEALYPPLLGDKPIPLTMWEFDERARFDAAGTLRGREVILTGFAVPASKGWYVARLQMSCCAADAQPTKIFVHGAPAPPKNAWVELVATWSPPPAGVLADEDVPAVSVSALRRIPKPAEPYE